MRQYEITLIAISEKRVHIQAESVKAAVDMMEKIYCETDALDFDEEDVTEVSAIGRAEEAAESMEEKWRYGDGRTGEVCGCGGKSVRNISVFGM